MNQPTVMTSSESMALRPISLQARTIELKRQRRGKAFVVAGWLLALVGVVLYCGVTFTAEPAADLAAIVLTGAVPGARPALVIVAGGVVLWLVGSVMHLGAALDAAELDARAQRQQDRT